jgi:hypothetical protein
MGLYLKQNETRSHLSSKVAADLTQRLNKRALENDDVKDAIILKSHRQTTGGGLFWSVVVTLIVLVVLIYVLFFF